MIVPHTHFLMVLCSNLNDHLVFESPLGQPRWSFENESGKSCLGRDDLPGYEMKTQHPDTDSVCGFQGLREYLVPAPTQLMWFSKSHTGDLVRDIWLACVHLL